MSKIKANGNEQYGSEKTDIQNHYEPSIFTDLDKQWKELDPSMAALLSKTQPKVQNNVQKGIEDKASQKEKSVSEANNIEAIVTNSLIGKDNQVNLWFAAINIAALPFHHLIPAVKLTSGLISNTSPIVKSHLTNSRAERLQR